MWAGAQGAQGQHCWVCHGAQGHSLCPKQPGLGTGHWEGQEEAVAAWLLSALLQEMQTTLWCAQQGRGEGAPGALALPAALHNAALHLWV